MPARIVWSSIIFSSLITSKPCIRLITEVIFNTFSVLIERLQQDGLISGLVCSMQRMTELKSWENYEGILE